MTTRPVVAFLVVVCWTLEVILLAGVFAGWWLR